MNKNWLKQSKSNVCMGVFITSMGILGNIEIAHAELSIIEKDPESSIVNQYEQYKAADLDVASFRSFVDQLNQRIELNPQDSLAWEILAKVYHEHGDIDYSVFGASEAVDLGATDAELYSILLTGSAFIAVDQIEAGYAEQINDKKFSEQYQAVLSKVYGTMYGFNYNEALPKASVRIASSRGFNKYAPKKRVSRKKRAAVKPKPKRNIAPKKTSRPVSKPKPQAPRKTSPSDDPFKILR